MTYDKLDKDVLEVYRQRLTAFWRRYDGQTPRSQNCGYEELVTQHFMSDIHIRHDVVEDLRDFWLERHP